MNAAEFLQKLKKEHLTGREFLALIGHTEISNEDYTEIKDNPSMTYARLVKILEDSPITGPEYQTLLKTARARSEKQAKKKKREDLENQLTSVLNGQDIAPSEGIVPSSETPNKPVPHITDEITITGTEIDTDVPQFNPPSVDELWGNQDEYEQYTSDVPPDVLEEFEQFGGSEDSDKSARCENLPKIIICLSLGVVLIFTSFITRYMTTGSWGLSGLSYRPPQSCEEMFTLQSKHETRSLYELTVPEFLPLRASRYTEPLQPLSLIAASDRYLFKIVEQSVHAVEIDSGKMSDAPSFTTDKNILGMLMVQNRLYVICTDSYLINIDNEDNAGASELHQSRITCYALDALNFTGEADDEFSMDGIYRKIILNSNGFFIIADYVPVNNTNPAQYAGYIPAYSINGDNSFIDIENIEFVRSGIYSNMTLIGSVGQRQDGSAGFSLNAVSGNSADCVHLGYGENALVMSFYSEDEDQSHILRYRVSGSVILNTDTNWIRVAGQVRQGFIDERDGVIRLVAISGKNTVLHIFNANMNSIARLGGITDKKVYGVAFDENTVYITIQDTQETYVIGTTKKNSPEFVNELNTLISAQEHYEWTDNYFFSVDIELNDEGEREGVTLTMYRDKLPESVYRLPLHDVVWHDYTKTSAENYREAVASNPDAGVIVVPVTYFNAVSRVESFFVLGYSQDDGFIEIGRIIEIGLNTSFHGALIRGGYIYTFWDNVIRSAATDSTTIATYDLGEHI